MGSGGGGWDWSHLLRALCKWRGGPWPGSGLWKAAEPGGKGKKARGRARPE